MTRPMRLQHHRHEQRVHADVCPDIQSYCSRLEKRCDERNFGALVETLLDKSMLDAIEIRNGEISAVDIDDLFKSPVIPSLN